MVTPLMGPWTLRIDKLTLHSGKHTGQTTFKDVLMPSKCPAPAMVLVYNLQEGLRPGTGNCETLKGNKMGESGRLPKEGVPDMRSDLQDHWLG